MDHESDAELILPGHHLRPSRNLYPIVKLLIERGHPVLDLPEKYGFCPGPSGMVCRLGRQITLEDWEAIKDRFSLPDTIVFYPGPKMGLIRDVVNRVDIVGYEEVMWGDVPITIDEWEERRAGA